MGTSSKRDRIRTCARRLRVLIIIAAETALLLLLAEAGLRAAGYGYSTKPFIEKRYSGETWRLLNDRYYAQFFNAADRKQHFDFPNTTVVRKAKPRDTYRIFLFGSSAAYGWFFQDYSMGHLLETMLHAAYPQRRFEVITVAFHAMNSFTMRYLADACSQMQPDLFLVYMGNNEMVGPYGLQSVLGSQCRSAALMEEMVRLNLFFSDLRLFQLLGVPAQEFFSKSVAHLTWGGYAGADDLADQRLERTYRVFRHNLEHICEAARKGGAETALCTVGYNLRDWPPTISGHRKPLQPAALLRWNLAYVLGTCFESAGAHQQAIAQYKHAAAIDDTHARLLYDLGRALNAIGSHEQARECFLRAVDNALSFCSANTQINGVIRDVASCRRDLGVRLVDTAQALAEHAADGIPGCESFYDHVHLTFEGNYAVASEMFHRIASLVDKAAPNGSVPEPPDLEQCMLRMGYSPGVRLRETQMALSFLKEQHDNPILPRLKSLQEKLASATGPDIDAAIAEADRKALELDSWNMPLLFRYVECRDALGRTRETHEDAQLLSNEAPCNWQYRNALIRAESIENPKAAYQRSRESAALYPEYAGIQQSAGNAALAAGEPQQAIRYYRKAIALNGHDPQLQRALGRTLASNGDFGGARTAMTKAIRLDPGQADVSASDLRSVLTSFQNAGKWEYAAATSRLVLLVAPEHTEFRTDLVAALCESKAYDAAWSEAAECKKRGYLLPENLIERLKRESGRTQ